MLNKKIGLVALILSLGVSSAFAHTHAPKDKWYVGADVQGNKMNVDSDMERITTNGTSFKDSLAGVSVFGGYRWDCLGAELGFTYLSKVNYTGTLVSGGTTLGAVSLSQKNYNAYIDGAYYYPLLSNLDLKAILGVGYLTTRFSGTPVINSNGTITAANGTTSFRKLGVRAGLGLQYYFSECVSSSLTYRYQTGNQFYKNMQTVALGVAYHF
jgi:opacity protein-like surface antigen